MFAEYCHKKIILANKVPIKDEIVDYMFDGIPNKSVRYQAMMQQFPDKETMLKAMENISGIKAEGFWETRAEDGV